MCIRDSLYRADVVKISKVKSTGGSTIYLDGFQYETEVLQFVPTSEGYYDFVSGKSVSYTHLDVYKRQHLYLS